MNHCANCNGSPRVEPDQNEIRRAADERARAMDEVAVHLLRECSSEDGLDLARTPFRPTAYALERAGYIGIAQCFMPYKELGIITKSGRLALEMAEGRP